MKNEGQHNDWYIQYLFFKIHYQFQVFKTINELMVSRKRIEFMGFVSVLHVVQNFQNISVNLENLQIYNDYKMMRVSENWIIFNIFP